MKATVAALSQMQADGAAGDVVKFVDTLVARDSSEVHCIEVINALGETLARQHHARSRACTASQGRNPLRRRAGGGMHRQRASSTGEKVIPVGGQG